jgi:hypothetical protein
MPCCTLPVSMDRLKHTGVDHWGEDGDDNDEEEEQEKVDNGRSTSSIRLDQDVALVDHTPSEIDSPNKYTVGANLYKL